jgi:hypothetical protein
VAAFTPFWPNLSLSSVNRVSKGPNLFAIAGERLTVDTTARAVAVSNKVFISDLARVDASRPTGLRLPRTAPTADGGPLIDRRTARVQLAWFQIGKSDTVFRHGTNLLLSWKLGKVAAYVTSIR